MIASVIPISPARTPFRAVRGWLSHFSERTKSAAAIRYVALPSQSLAKSDSAAVVCARSCAVERRLVTAGSLPTEHFEHPVGDPETADDINCGRNYTRHAEYVG